MTTRERPAWECKYEEYSPNVIGYQLWYNDGETELPFQTVYRTVARAMYVARQDWHENKRKTELLWFYNMRGSTSLTEPPWYDIRALYGEDEDQADDSLP